MFDRQVACVILVPEGATEEEMRAAALLQQTLAKAAGRSPDDFAIVRTAPTAGPVIALRGKAESGGPKLEEIVAWRVSAHRVEITAYPADAIEAAAAWFLEKTIGARWFMPGELGEHIPLRKELRLALGGTAHRPSYISRRIGLRDTHGQADWSRANRLRRWFKYGHAMNNFFKPEDLAANPDLIPLVNGRRRIPAAGERHWQPNIASEAAAVHAAGVLARQPEFSSAIGMNDSFSFDQSEETRRLLGEPRWFRHKPDFSPLVFRFVNEVAKRVPERYLGAYAYDWTEDTPPFPIERNVVPYLTADRSQWFDASFAEEDKALIRRWLAAGPEVVGLYDYYYGLPFLIPRPTLYAVAQSIPFAHDAGVRAFYAETYANWALDGPKSWLAAQLLWDASRNPAELLDIYYAEFWQEAAGPMREFFDRCDEQWRNQPLPSYWIKYFKDEHQYLLFPPEARGGLRRLLDQAMAEATTETTRERVRFVAAGFSVTEAFCRWSETRDRLSRRALAAEIDPVELREMEDRYAAELEQMQTQMAQVKARHPLALSAELLVDYTRNDPRRRSAWRRGETGFAAGGEEPGARSQQTGEPGRKELLADPELARLEIGPTAGFFDLEWVRSGPWQGYGEPYETRRVSLEPGAKGESMELRFLGCKQETFSQVVEAVAEKRYVARVKVKGTVSPGNMTFLILNFQDAEGRTLGMGTIDRLPVGTFAESVELVTWADAPPGTAWVGLGVRALNQVEEDVAVFSGFSLREAGVR